MSPLAFERAVEIAEAAQRCHSGGSGVADPAEAPEASIWLRGGVVAYRAEVKNEVLGVDPGPVVTAWAARKMARGVPPLPGADVGISVTGLGGPDEEEGQPPGTVWLGLWTKDGYHHHLVKPVDDAVSVTYPDGCLPEGRLDGAATWLRRLRNVQTTS